MGYPCKTAMLSPTEHVWKGAGRGALLSQQQQQQQPSHGVLSLELSLGVCDELSLPEMQASKNL